MRESMIYFWQSNQAIWLELGKHAVMAAMVLLFAWLLVRGIKRAVRRINLQAIGMDDTALPLMATLLSYLIYTVALLIVLDVFGVNTTSIIALLGAAGIAIALALKDTLGNIAAGIVLLFLRPFKPGDFIECGSVIGNVREIGLFTTILETSDGLYISAPNASLWGEPVKNYTRNGRRRLELTVGIDYADSLDTGLNVLLAVANADGNVLQEPGPQAFVQSMADSSVNLQLRVWTDVKDYWETSCRLNKAIKEAVEDAGLSIPFPQQVVTYVNKVEES